MDMGWIDSTVTTPQGPSRELTYGPASGLDGGGGVNVELSAGVDSQLDAEASTCVTLAQAKTQIEGEGRSRPCTTHRIRVASRGGSASNRWD